MADPVSWHVIETGWTVVDSTGAEIGSVAEVMGDPELDIFSGLAVKTGLLERARYVPAEQVGGIEEGLIRLELGPDEVDRLAERRS